MLNYLRYYYNIISGEREHLIMTGARMSFCPLCYHRTPIFHHSDSSMSGVCLWCGKEIGNPKAYRLRTLDNAIKQLTNMSFEECFAEEICQTQKCVYLSYIGGKHCELNISKDENTKCPAVYALITSKVKNLKS